MMCRFLRLAYFAPVVSQFLKERLDAITIG
jgi:hypothetical protein